MKIPSLVRLPRHRQFDYKPIHYDADREELLDRVAQAKKKYEEEDDEERELSMRNRKIQFERKTLKRKFELSLQLYLVVIMVFDLIVLYTVSDLSNMTWGILLALQIVAIALKVKFDKRK